MQFKWKLFSLFLLVFLSSEAQSIWTAGPMLHVNIGREKTRLSYGFEFAYWNFTHFPYSYDFCAEFERKRIRAYGEIQTGISLAGVSAGPVLEYQTDNSALKVGFQTSVWGNYGLGFDVRIRVIDKHAFVCPGMYVKTGFDGKDANGNHISNEDTFHHSHHH